MKFIYLLFSLTYAKMVILTPKSTINTFSNIDFNSFSVEHNFEHIVTFDKLVFYKTNINNYNKFTSSINLLFDMEYEQVYRVNPVHMSDNNVILIQQPGNIHLETQTPWHLDRITKHNLPLDGTYEYSKKNSCHKNTNVTINTYIIDTGVDVDHYELEGRAVFLENFTEDGFNTDKNGHGTFCAGNVASKSFGVCTDANIFGVKVLDAQGSGSTSGVLKGMQYVFNRHLTQLKLDHKIRSIVSMSLGGGYSLAMNRAAEKMITSDTLYLVVASGNENGDACKTSPASARGVFSVMAMSKDDNRAYFSNFGKCTDIYSPGVDIQSIIPDGKTAVFSGTSMSTPILAGTINHYIDMYPYLNMKTLKEKILNDATKNTIRQNPKNTKNLMVYLHRD